ncbi:MAG: hypothetical protein ONB15_10385 [candidate division KSB1 bacterium]|nr:hypothetical protein [candidate division KSB1 bacterium]
MRQLAEFLPLTHVVTLLRGLWIGNAWGNYPREIAILAAVLVAGLVVSARTFRWE